MNAEKGMKMVTELQSNVLSAGTVKKVMPSCLIYAIVQSATFMVDTIVAGHFMGAEAVAAVAIGLPIIGLMLAFTAAIMHGGFLKMLGCMGKSDMQGYNRMYSIAMTMTIVLDVLFLLLCLFGTNGIVNACGGAKATAQTVVYAKLYIRTASPMILFFCVGTLFQVVVATFGYQTDRMLSSALNIAVNVAASVTAVIFLPEEYKIAGLGIGSAAGAFAQMVYAYIAIKCKKIVVKFRLYAPNKRNIIDALDCLRRGLPSSIDTLLDSVCGSVVNNLILSLFANGTGVLALVSVVKTLNTVTKACGRTSYYASEPLFGILYGGRDREGIKKTFTASLRCGIIYAAGVAVLVIAMIYPILSFYDLSGNTDAAIGVVIIAIAGIISVFPFTFSAVYESTDHLSLSLLLTSIPDSVLYPLLIVVFHKALGVTGIWVALGFNFVLFFALYYLVLMIVTKKVRVPLDKLLALGKMDKRSTVIDVSIPAESESVTFVSEKLQGFFKENGTSDKIAMYSALCMEEIAADYLEHRKGSKHSDKKSYMDIKAFRDDGKIEIILRNYDEPYNPLLFERDKESFSKIGVTMVQRMAQDITYSYSYHLNVVSVKIDG